MTTSYPPCVTWPALACIAAVLIARYLFFNKSGYESAFNNLLTCLFVANILRERTVEVMLDDAGIMSITTAQHASLVAVVFANAELLRFIRLWKHPPADTERYTYLTPYVAAAAVSGGFWIAATPARQAGQTLEEFGGWTAMIAWTILVSIFVTTGAGLAYNSVREFRGPETSLRERLLAASGVVIGSFIVATSVDVPVLAAADALGRVDAEPILTWLHGQTIFLETVGTCLFGLVPFALAAMAQVGLDTTSCRLRRIRPLLIDLMDAAPEVVFQLPDPYKRRGWTALDLHQAVVQIRDGILHLRPWMLTLSEATADRLCTLHRVPDGERAEAILAFQLAAAIRRKDRGRDPAPAANSSSGRAASPPSRSADLDGETAEMLRLAKWWPVASTHQPLEENHVRST